MNLKSDQFFPSQVDDFSQNWYSANLKLMNEPSLFNSTDHSSNFICRCLWLKAFRPSKCIRVQANANRSAMLIEKQTNCDAGEEEPAELVKDTFKAIDASALSEISKLIDGMSFFEIPTNEAFPIGHDGERWIFEVVCNGRYHIVDRYCPDVVARDRPLVELGESLLRLADDTRLHKR